ncbi:MAG: methyltransferase [Candidatus Scalindua rubra]|uniref:site-specific DNA-methyltransferase (adenine-specific) n=1 Tax=Candidatus Scalindua rubra TaxID=1872076 RepID=A0A1E3XCX2_9BACT|nr:MAG: methyltransferase [Candidatus Scalindua rubra]
MARKTRNKKEKIEAYRHEKDTRKNAVLAGLASYDTSKPKPKKYQYNPHLDPQLIWSGKAEHTSFEVPTVSLHIHEHIATEAIIRSVKRKDPQMYLFAKPDMPLKKLVEFYQHDMDWTNRLILGDSLLITNSLLEREMMAGKVQCIYVDPPYGVRFSSNFQPTTKQRDVKDQDNFMVREPEQIRAYRDTWQLGIHSYLTYLRDRLLLSRELLTESGSIFVQISDENLHHVRELMDEVFGKENFVNLITFKKSGSQTSIAVPTVADFLIWYCKDKSYLKFRPLYSEKKIGLESAEFRQLLLKDGTTRSIRSEELMGQKNLPDGSRIFKSTDLHSRTGSESTTQPYEFQGKTYTPRSNAGWRTTIKGLQNLEKSRRLLATKNTLRYIHFFDDFPFSGITSIWDDVMGEANIQYVVQTNVKVITRCILMTTDPGDLVFDPTCGSGTTAYVAEQWGRRWITCDTSRVALTLARQRLMTAVYPYYKLADEKMGVKGGFIYEEVPHITLKQIAKNEPPQKETLLDKPEIDRSKVRITGPFTVEGIPQHSVTEFEDVNYETEIERESHTVIERSEETKQSKDEILAPLGMT